MKKQISNVKLKHKTHSGFVLLIFILTLFFSLKSEELKAQPLEVTFRTDPPVVIKTVTDQDFTPGNDTEPKPDEIKFVGRVGTIDVNCRVNFGFVDNKWAILIITGTGMTFHNTNVAVSQNLRIKATSRVFPGIGPRFFWRVHYHGSARDNLGGVLNIPTNYWQGFACAPICVPLPIIQGYHDPPGGAPNPWTPPDEQGVLMMGLVTRLEGFVLVSLGTNDIIDLPKSAEVEVADSGLAIYPRISTNPIYTEHCVNSILINSNLAPIVGARIDFLRTGANPDSGFAITDSSGHAEYCYTGTNMGNDVIIGSYLDLRDTVFKTWDSPLPVELTSFYSTVNEKDVTLNWSTSEEVNNSGFDIERKSVKSIEWTKVGFVQGNGTTSEPKNYSFIDASINSGKYNYRLKQIDYNGNFQYYDLQNEVVIGIPEKFGLSQNYPNPFNPTTTINYDIPKDGIVKLIIYDNNGKEVNTLVNEFKSAGYYTVDFEAANLPSGVYFYKLESNNFVATKRMIILK